MPNGSTSWPTAATRRRRCGCPTAGRSAEAEGWEAPGYWRKIDGDWLRMTLGGLRAGRSGRAGLPCQLLRGRRLRALGGQAICRARPNGRSRRAPAHLTDAFGIVWQWTRSAYAPYPGYRAGAGGARRIQRQVHGQSDGAARQLAARRPTGHARASYRNFFYPPARWQFSGLRLADYSADADRRRHEREAIMAASSQTPPATSTPLGAAMPFATDVLAGLSATPKRISPKYFYDAARLAAVRADHRAAGILSDAHASSRSCATMPREIAALYSGRRGAGRIRQRLEPQGAHPARRRAERRGLCAGRHLGRDACSRRRRELRQDFPRLRVLPVAADFTQPFELPAAIARRAAGRASFPGSTIGNFEPHEAAAFLRHAAQHARARRDADRRRRPGQGRRRAERRLQRRRRRDRARSTSTCSTRINRELGGDFDLDALRASRLLQSRAPPHRDASGEPQARRR